MFDSLRPHGLQHTRPRCPSPTPRVHPNSRPLSQWYHPTISSTVVPFCLPSIFPSIRIFSNGSPLRIRWPKFWSFSINISPSNEHQDWPPLRWTDWISLEPKRLSRVFSNTTVQNHHFFNTQLPFQSNSHIHTRLLKKTIALTKWTFVGKPMSLLFNMLSRLVITFLARSKCLLISWLQSPSAVILEPPKIKSATVSTISPSICHKVMRPWS